jgi:phage terminase small subunit
MKPTKPAKKLTEKERLFCSFYVTYHNASRAAIEAGYSEKTAYEIGSQNLRKLHIIAEIDRLSSDLIAHMAELGITKERNIQEAAKIAYTSMAHLHNTWIERKDFEKLTDEQKSCIQEIDTKIEYTVLDGAGKRKVEYVKIKLYSKTDAIKLINDMMGWNAPTKIDAPGIVQIIVSNDESKL